MDSVSEWYFLSLQKVINCLKSVSKNPKNNIFTKRKVLPMLTDINPKLPMRDKNVTRAFYSEKLGFEEFGTIDFDGYLMMQKDHIQLHFFEFKDLNPKENYGQVYIRTNKIDSLYLSFLDKNVKIHPNSPLEVKPWGQKEFSILDPDNNLLTFGQSL